MKQKIIHWLKENLGINNIIERQDKIEEKQTYLRNDYLRLIKEQRASEGKTQRREFNSSRSYRNRNND